MLYPYLPHKTAGNSCSALDVCVPKEKVPELIQEIIRYVSDESGSPEWGVAIKQGFIIPSSLRMYGCHTRSTIVSLEEAKEIAREHDIQIEGGLGIIGALAAVSLSSLSTDILLNSEMYIQEYISHSHQT
jgi:tRNA(Ile2) C34 agmatinyltransferase TiaS